MVDKIILELPADTTGGDILISAEDRAAAVAAAAASEAAAGVAAAASATATTKAAEASADAAAAEAAKLAAQGVPTTNDTVMAAVAADPASAFSMQQSATYAPTLGARPGNAIVWLGDSLTQWQDAATPANTPGSPESHSQRTSLGNLGSLFSGQRALYVNNAGIGGNTTAQMLARFDTDVTPYAPAVVHLLGGTNDIGTLALADYMSNIAALIAKIRGIGAVPILGLIPPKNTNMATVSAWNIALRRYAISEGIAVVDYYTPLVDTATGAILSAYNGDGTHPNADGFVVMAKTFAAVAATLLPPALVPLPQSNAYANNLLGNGLFPGTGAPWTGSGQSTEPGVAPVLGNWMSIAGTGTAVTIYQNVATAPVAGHRYALLGRIKTTASAGVNGFLVRNRITLGAGSVDMMPLNNVQATIDDGVFYTEYTCPAAPVSQQVLCQINAGVTGTLKVAQIALYDLTAMGVA